MNKPFILVPLDGTDRSLAALPVAKVLSEIEQATLSVFYVRGHGPAGEEWHTRPAARAPMLEGLRIESCFGNPAAEILRAAREKTPLAIILCRQSGGECGKILGHTTMDVLHNARCPIVLVPSERGPIPWRLHHILAPHDGKPTTSATLPPAAKLAEHSHAELLVAHVADVRAAPEEPGSLTTPRYIDQPQHEWPAWTGEFMNRISCICPLKRVHVRMLLVRGETATEVLRLSEKQSSDLIAVAWRGVWESPAANILLDAHCPVMVMRT